MSKKPHPEDKAETAAAVAAAVEAEMVLDQWQDRLRKSVQEKMDECWDQVRMDGGIATLELEGGIKLRSFQDGEHFWDEITDNESGYMAWRDAGSYSSLIEKRKGLSDTEVSSKDTFTPDRTVSTLEVRVKAIIDQAKATKPVE